MKHPGRVRFEIFLGFNVELHQMSPDSLQQSQGHRPAWARPAPPAERDIRLFGVVAREPVWVEPVRLSPGDQGDGPWRRGGDQEVR